MSTALNLVLQLFCGKFSVQIQATVKMLSVLCIVGIYNVLLQVLHRNYSCADVDILKTLRLFRLLGGYEIITITSI